MLQKFFDRRPWFAPKQYGYGAGLPITWQGWVLTLSYVALIVGIGQVIENGTSGPRGAAIVMAIVATAGFIAIVCRRTQGGWRWRWGDRD